LRDLRGNMREMAGDLSDYVPTSRASKKNTCCLPVSQHRQELRIASTTRIMRGVVTLLKTIAARSLLRRYPTAEGRDAYTYVRM
jgi:hypothetical protein